MSTVTFDTLKLVDALEKVQIPREQARAIVNVVRESHDATDVATKADVRDLRKEMEIMRRDIIIKLSGMLMLGFGTVLAMMLK